MAYPTISNLPPAPTRSDGASDFTQKADAFVAALPTLVTQINAAGEYMECVEGAVQSSVEDAASSALLAQQQASRARRHENAAQDAEQQAQTYAAAAQAAAGLPALAGNANKVLAVKSDASGVLFVDVEDVAPVASTSQAGLVELATNSETATGTLASRAVTPASLKPLLDAKAPLDSPFFTGAPKAPSPARSDATDRLANTWWIKDWYANDIAPGVQSALGYTPVRQGGRPGMLSNNIFIGWDGSDVKLSVDDNDTALGSLIGTGNGDAKISGLGFLKAFAGTESAGAWQFTIPTSIGNIIVKLFNVASIPATTAQTVNFPNGAFPNECLGVIPSASSDQGTGSSDANRYTCGTYNRTASGFTLVNDGATSTFFVLAFGR